MKKLLLIAAIVAFTAANAHASAEEVVEGMGHKIARGAIDIVTGPVEFPYQIIKGYQRGVGAIENEAGSKVVGTVLGIFRGASHTAGRMASGAKDLIGFWAVDPMDNEGVGVPFDAERSWEEGVAYSIFEPNFEEGVKPIGRKLARGIGNGLFGIVEIPGQTLRGASEGNVVKGLAKGFWFSMSRGVHGFSDIFTSLVPNHPDTAGNAHFNGEWPWTVMGEEME